MYRQLYYEALDLIVQAIKECFYQPEHRIHQSLENFLLKAAREEDFEEDLNFSCSIYGSDIHKCNLRMQLATLSISVKEKVVNIFDVRNYLKQLTDAERALLNVVVIVMKLLLVMPATNATSKRSFSALRCVNSYLRSTMGQERLNHLMM